MGAGMPPSCCSDGAGALMGGTQAAFRGPLTSRHPLQATEERTVGQRHTHLRPQFEAEFRARVESWVLGEQPSNALESPHACVRSGFTRPMVPL